MEQLRKFFNTVQNISKIIIGLCMISMMVIIFIQTSTRYLIFYSIHWSEEVSRYLYVALTLLGLNLAITSKQLVRIDIIDISQFQRSPALGISMQIMYLIVGLGFLLSAIATIFDLYDAIKAEYSTNNEA